MKRGFMDVLLTVSPARQSVGQEASGVYCARLEGQNSISVPFSKENASRCNSQQGQPAVRRMQGLLSFLKKYGRARVEEACAIALEMEVYDYRFVRRYLERNAQPPLSLRQVDPLIRQLTLYRDLIPRNRRSSSA
jgi:hypothetical protein